MPKSAQFFPDKAEVESEKGADISVCQCSSCGLVQLSNAPVSYYKEVIRSAAVSDEMTEFRYHQFENWLESYDLVGKKVIEIGCGSGEYMTIMNKFDVDVFGLEQRAESVEKGRKEGLTVQQGFIEDIVPNNGSFDAFYMLNFLEHLPEPNKSLKKIAACLNEGAIGLVEVPNFDMILRQKLFSEFISDHLFYFTKESLIFTLQRNGFEVLECQETWHEYSLSAVVRKREPISLTIFDQQRTQITAELNRYIDQFNESAVAIWGAGHQALAVISLADIGSRIRYVVDSAPFKQNKYTPASHIPIVPPTTLVSDPVESVIVMAASYSDEVAKLISQNYTGIKIAVLRDTGLEIVKDLTVD
jgi:2-polyprenyl-3-methyl-5-hydroxy-6-metoxy-1,4-benzoquinol methylase